MIWEFHPEAELELIEAATRYESEIPGLGKRFSFEVERAISLLRENPMIGVAVDDQDPPLRAQDLPVFFDLRQLPRRALYSGGCPWKP